MKTIPTLSALFTITLLLGCSETTQSQSTTNTEPATPTGNLIEAKRAEPASAATTNAPPPEAPEPVTVEAAVVTQPAAPAPDTDKTSADMTIPIKGTVQYKRYIRFPKLDTDKNGSLNKAEYAAGLKNMMETKGYNETKQKNTINYGFKTRDLDSNGSISRAEFIK